MTSMKPVADPIGRVSAASAQGGRDHQEDRTVCEWIEGPSAGWLLAVFDGHRGAATADQASQSLLSLFASHLQAQLGDVPKALREVFLSLNRMTQDRLSGSTASVVFIPQSAENAILAVLGDSPIAILDAKGRIHIGPEHNVRTNLKERAAAEARGGVYQGGYLEDSDLSGIGLQMARSLGDADLKRVLNREPEIESVELGGRGIVLVGTDGLLLQGEDAYADQLTRLLNMIQRGADAEAVVKDAVARRTGDNVTAIVWRSI